MSRQIRANYDDEGIYVYQAFKPSTVKTALAKGTFGEGFNLNRMTWIKPSFGWMLYRSGYATKPGQEGILKIKLTHDGFAEILSQSVASNFQAHLYKTPEAWQKELHASDVRHQWDPDRTLDGRRLDRRAIQIGLRGKAVRHYVEEWIVGLEEVTALAHAIRDAVDYQMALPDLPLEQVYPVDPVIAHHLGIVVAR